MSGKTFTNFSFLETGPVTIREGSQKHSFINDIDNLTATDGGDCAELAFKGMQDAFDNGPYPSSSMFVFTDAEPKDGDMFGVENLILAAQYDRTYISFFLDGSICGSKSNIDKFRKVAKETEGKPSSNYHYINIK